MARRSRRKKRKPERGFFSFLKRGSYYERSWGSRNITHLSSRLPSAISEKLRTENIVSVGWALRGTKLVYKKEGKSRVNVLDSAKNTIMRYDYFTRNAINPVE
ncbi:MAG: hypothetical protein ABIH20_06270 [Candidatus Diapherotrites archaeon]